MASSSNERNLKNLVINKVDSQSTFDQMKESGLINVDELYLIKEGTKDRVLDVIVNGESTVEDGISEFNVPTAVSELENDSGYITTAEETDPVFSASAAAGITSTDIQNWNNKTSNIGTITGVSVNGTSIATSGVANITSVPASILTGAIPNGVTATTQTQSDNSNKIATTAYVDTAIGNLPEPMVFKGSLGTGGTITALPTAAASNEGHTYKVITNGTYAGQAAKIGDTFISTGSRWELIPSGDEPSGTVTSITLSATSPIAIDNNAAITTSGTRTISHASSGVSAGTYKSVTVNSTGHVTGGTNPTTLSGYGITDAKIANGVITLGSNTITPLTEHQDITGKQDKITTTNKLDYSLIDNTPDMSNYVPNTRTVNGKALSSDITLSASDTGAVAFDDTYITDANTFYSVNGYSKTRTSTTNLPSVCTGDDRWGVIFFIAENASNHTGTQMYFPIDGTYKGRIFYRSMVRGTPSTWLILPTKTSELTNDSGFLTEHQDISGKQDKITASNKLSYDLISGTPTIPTITDTYSSTSSDGMSGKAVASAISGKQNTLTTQTAYSAKGSATKVPQITTNTLGQVTGITEVTITQPTVNNGTLTIQKNGTDVATFGANASSNVTANITVPTVTDTYSETSSDAMSGKAVASALSSFSGGPQKIKDGDGSGSVYTSGAVKPTAEYAFAEGSETQALGMCSHAEGRRTISNGNASHAEGYGSLLTVLDTTVHTVYNSTNKTIIIKGLATTPYSKNIVDNYIIAGQAYLSASAGGTQISNKIKQIDEVYGDDARTIIYFEETPSSSITSLAVNAQVHLYLYGSLAAGQGAHAEGLGTVAISKASHVEGEETVATAAWTHAEGRGTIASSQYQHVEGKYNKPGSFLHIVGNGTNNDNRSNAHTLDSSGNAWFAGNVRIGGTDYNDSNAKQINVITNLEDGTGRFGSLKQARANSCSGNDTAALGINTIGEGDWSFVSGYGSVVKGQKSTAMGNHACALYTNSVAIGDKVTSQTSNGIAIGNAKSLESTKDELCIECPISNIESQNGYTMVTLSTSDNPSSAQIVKCIAYMYTSSTTTTISETLPVISYNTATKTLTLPFTSINLANLTYIRLYKNATVAYSNSSIAIGTNVQTESNNAVAIGTGLISNSQYQLVQGSYNNTTGSSNLLYVLGNGTDTFNRSNAFTIDKDGNAWFKGNIKVGGENYLDTNAVEISGKPAFINKPILNLTSYYNKTLTSSERTLISKTLEDYSVIVDVINRKPVYEVIVEYDNITQTSSIGSSLSYALLDMTLSFGEPYGGNNLYYSGEPYFLIKDSCVYPDIVMGTYGFSTVGGRHCGELSDLHGYIQSGNGKTIAKFDDGVLNSIGDGGCRINKLIFTIRYQKANDTDYENIITVAESEEF